MKSTDYTLGMLEPPLEKNIQAALDESRGITGLYSHQASAIAALSAGQDVIVSTSTASGKSVIYQVKSRTSGTLHGAE